MSVWGFVAPKGRRKFAVYASSAPSGQGYFDDPVHGLRLRLRRALHPWLQAGAPSGRDGRDARDPVRPFGARRAGLPRSGTALGALRAGLPLPERLSGRGGRDVRAQWFVANSVVISSAYSRSSAAAVGFSAFSK